MYEKVISKERVVEFRVFDFVSLEKDGLDLTHDFLSSGLYKFCAENYDYYLKLVREFYSNLCVDEIDEQFDDKVLKSRVNVINLYVTEELLYKLFNLEYRGRKCMGAEFKRNEEG